MTMVARLLKPEVAKRSEASFLAFGHPDREATATVSRR
jgi:hypothetical protein